MFWFSRCGCTIPSLYPSYANAPRSVPSGRQIGEFDLKPDMILCTKQFWLFCGPMRKTINVTDGTEVPKPAKVTDRPYIPTVLRTKPRYAVQYYLCHIQIARTGVIKHPRTWLSLPLWQIRTKYMGRHLGGITRDEQCSLPHVRSSVWHLRRNLLFHLST